MEAVRKVLKIDLPKYLKSLPIPSNVEGFTKLTTEEWTILAPFLVTILVLLVTILLPLCGGRSKGTKSNRLNNAVQLEKEKVVDTCDIEDMFTKGSLKCIMCRCWKSKKFPFCDGSHNEHNKVTGDNVGPLIIQKKA